MALLCRGISVAAFALVLLAPAVAAQTHSTTPNASQCDAAARVVAHARDRGVVSRSYGTLLRCPNAGSALADMWATPPGNGERLARLRAYSADVADRRILLATLAVVQRTESAPAIRRAALDVVLSQYRPDIAIGSSTWEDAEHASLAIRSDYYQVAGASPITDEDRAAVVSAFRTMAEAESGTRWGRVFKRIATDLPGRT